MFINVIIGQRTVNSQSPTLSTSFFVLMFWGEAYTRIINKQHVFTVFVTLKSAPLKDWTFNHIDETAPSSGQNCHTFTARDLIYTSCLEPRTFACWHNVKLLSGLDLGIRSRFMQLINLGMGTSFTANPFHINNCKITISNRLKHYKWIRLKENIKKK